MKALFGEFKGLGQARTKYEFFLPMMTRVVENKLRFVGHVGTKLCDVSLKEGDAIGGGLALAMASNLTAEAGVDEWIERFPCLGELDREVWFRSMMNAAAKRLLGEVSWGLKGRVYLGAGLSVLDMATDIFVIVGYMEKEETRGYGYSLLWMVVSSLAFQLIIVFIQHRKKPKELVKELLIVLALAKPAVNARRVCSGQKMEEHHVFDATFEHVATKGAELLCESVPGCILQSLVLLKNGGASRYTIGSIIVSAATSGVCTATTDFDYDVDPKRRKETPEFYGYIPAGNRRTVIFACMVLNCSLMLLLRSISAAMLLLAGRGWFGVYVAGDMVLYLGVKAARGDFHYWIPVDGVAGLLVSLLMRVWVKLATDYTGGVQSRAPGELGGIYWTGNMFLALLGSFFSVWAYAREGVGGVEERGVWTLVGSLSGVWLLSFGVFLLLMKQEYRATFWSTRLGKQWTMDFFLLGEVDSKKKSTVAHSKAQWREVRGEVKEWVVGNWWRWKEEKPSWFTEAWKGKLPQEWIPEEDAVARERAGERSGWGSIKKIAALRQVEPVN